jgi:hypothetical protein
MCFLKTTFILDRNQPPKHCSNCQLLATECKCDQSGDELEFSESCQNASKIRLLRKHQRTTIVEEASPVKLCKKHGDQIIKFWCRRCSTLVCSECLLFNHKDHEFKSIEEAGNDLGVQVST